MGVKRFDSFFVFVLEVVGKYFFWYIIFGKYCMFRYIIGEKSCMFVETYGFNTKKDMKGKIIIELEERQGKRAPHAKIYSDLEYYEILGLLEVAKDFVKAKKHKKI
jgi:hypothetical protein